MPSASHHLSLPTWSLFLIHGRFISSMQLSVSLGRTALEEGSNTPISLQWQVGVPAVKCCSTTVRDRTWHLWTRVLLLWSGSHTRVCLGTVYSLVIMRNCKWPPGALVVYWGREGGKAMLTLKTKSKDLGFEATPDQIRWVHEEMRLTP